MFNLPQADVHPLPVDRIASLGLGTPGNDCRHRWRLLALLLPVLTVLTGCGNPQQPTSTREAPPPTVIVAKATSQPVETRARFVGRAVAVDKVELRARVQGFLKERKFTEGKQVEVGELLFVIEPDQYESIVEQREADVQKAVADEENASAQLRRGEELLKSKNIPQSKVDELQAAESIAKASISQAKASLTAAKLDLGYTQITAPVAGRIGLAKYTVGNLVGPDSDPLATIVSRDPIYVQFPLTQRELLQAKRRIKKQGGDAASMEVQARLPDDTIYDQKGQIDFVDVTTDPGTDTVTVRARFPNPDGTLVDGQYLGVVVQEGEPASAIVISQSALQVDQQGVFVLIVDKENKAQIRRIETGADQGADVVVTKGLAEGDLVITQGVQKVRPGQVVSATPAEKPGGSAAP
ncbi:MAG: efflux RND transporter periplasmic adaptor subunit [Chromatiaceae bacterium]|nr:efflux RND transporter periplasmic adaptor subunit [Chromatiaceae bacterium]